MGNIITSLFGKKTGIIEMDVNEKFILPSYKESQIFDAKTIIYPLNDDGRESQIIKPLSSFLNSFEGIGLLALGISTGGSRNNTCKSIVPIKEEIIRNEEQLRAIIIGNISMIPNIYTPPKILIEKVKTTEGNVFLVEIERLDNTCVYYSRISNRVYIRNNDESKEMPLIDTISLIQRKIVPKIFLYLDEPKDTGNGKKIRIGLKNEGLEPGKYVLTSLHFIFNNQSVNVKVNGRGVMPITHMNEGYTCSFQINSAYSPSQALLYPDVTVIIGDIEIESGSNFQIGMQVNNHENKGRSIQKFEIINTPAETIVKEISRTFNPYIA